MPIVFWVFSAVSATMGLLVLRQWLRDRHLSLASRTRLLLAVIFAAIAIWQGWSLWGMS